MAVYETNSANNLMNGGSRSLSKKQIPVILTYKTQFLYSEIDVKTECILYTGHTKREGNIWHNLGGNTIILFFNINKEYMNNNQIY